MAVRRVTRRRRGGAAVREEARNKFARILRTETNLRYLSTRLFMNHIPRPLPLLCLSKFVSFHFVTFTNLFTNTEAKHVFKLSSCLV